ncbi:ABC transporter permease [Anaerococcus provencensis]|uniref:ABC transporter permease n=1 Tax=Anaerococcus provencensis TaxID=938293 RepID=UPI0002F7AA98|nr:ABC transporter permease [Anaerococcus provencensis]
MNKKENKFLPYLMVLPSLIMTIGFVLIPIINSIARSFNNPEGIGFTLDNYTYFFTDPLMKANILYTLEIALITVVLSIIFAYPFAIYVRFSNSTISKKLYNLTLMPRFIPGIVAVYAIMQIIGDAGLIARIGKVFGQTWQLGLMYNKSGIIFTNLWFNIPFATLIIAPSLSAISWESLNSARDIGANKWSIFKNIIWPLSYREVLVAATFVFMSNVGSFTTPYLIGANNPKMLGVTLNDIFSVYRNFEQAAALSVIMFLICAISAVAYILSNMKKKEREIK